MDHYKNRKDFDFPYDSQSIWFPGFHIFLEKFQFLVSCAWLILTDAKVLLAPIKEYSL